jgi:uncharacterized membrane protein/protein-disulfide isomerase
MTKKSTTSIFLLFIGSILGIFASGFSWYEHILLRLGFDVSSSLCNINSSFNCGAINKSEYAELFGFPLAGIGFFFYFSVFIGALYCTKTQAGRVFWGSMLISSVFSVLLSFYLFYISKIIIGVFCLYCMVMYLANGIIAFASVSGTSLKGRAASLFEATDAPFQFVKALLGKSSNHGTALSAWLIIAGFVFTLYVHAIAPSLLLTNTKKAGPQPTIAQWERQSITSIPINANDAPLSVRDYTFGDPKAPIQIVEFSDFECSACRMKFPFFEDILSKYKDKIFFVPKHFPLDNSCNSLLSHSMHQHACFAANFVQCVAEQGKFADAFRYVFTEPLLDSPSTRAQITSAFFTWGKSVGLDIDSLSSCVTSDKYMTKIKADIDLSVSLSVEQTPTFFVNGRKTNFEMLEKVIEHILQ